MSIKHQHLRRSYKTNNSHSAKQSHFKRWKENFYDFQNKRSRRKHNYSKLILPESNVTSIKWNSRHLANNIITESVHLMLPPSRLLRLNVFLIRITNCFSNTKLKKTFLSANSSKDAILGEARVIWDLTYLNLVTNLKCNQRGFLDL